MARTPVTQVLSIVEASQFPCEILVLWRVLCVPKPEVTKQRQRIQVVQGIEHCIAGRDSVPVLCRAENCPQVEDCRLPWMVIFAYGSPRQVTGIDIAENMWVKQLGRCPHLR